MHPNTITHDPATGDLYARLLSVGGRAFRTRGYALTTMQEICADAGSAPVAVGELFPSKYELFRECTLSAARTLLSAAEAAASETPANARQARQQLAATLEALGKANIAARTEHGYLRGEFRYLTEEDQRELFAIESRIHERIEAPLRRMRPELGDLDASLLAAAAATTLASVKTHPTSLPAPKIQLLVTVSAMRLLDSSDLPTTASPPFEPQEPSPWMVDSSTRGRIKAASIRLISRRGYRAVDIDDVSAATGLTPAEIEEETGRIAELLHDSFAVSQSALKEAMHAARAASPRPRETLLGLSRAYVGRFFADPQLMSVFILDSHHLPPQFRDSAARLYDEIMDGWREALCSVRPELNGTEAVFLIYAALSIAADLGMAVQWKYDQEIMAKIEYLVVTTLIGR